MKDLITRLTELLGRISGVISSLPNTASLEKDSPVAVHAENLRANATALEQTLKDAKGLAEQLAAKETEDISPERKQAIIDDALKAGELLKKSDHDAALQVAVTTRETELNNEFASRQQADQLAAENRAKLATVITDPAALAAVPAEVLAKENFEAASLKITDRFAKLKEKGITVPSILTEVASMKADADGDAEFARRSEQWEALAKGVTRAPGAPIPPTNKGEPDKKLVML